MARNELDMKQAGVGYEHENEIRTNSTTPATTKSTPITNTNLDTSPATMTDKTLDTTHTVPLDLESKCERGMNSTSSSSAATSSEPSDAAKAEMGLGQRAQGMESAFKRLSWVDRLLALWILLAMIIGILLGNYVPSTGPALQKGKFVGVSVPIAIGLLVMMYPILCRVKFESLHLTLRSKKLWVQLGISLVLNWIVAPLIMLGLAWAFLPDHEGLREGLILVGLARCIAMVLIWTDLAGGDNEYCAILVAVNSILQMILYAPLAVLFINVISQSDSHIQIGYSIVATSVAAYLGIPLGAAILTRFTLRNLISPKWYEDKFLRYAGPWSLIGLLYTILVLFASEGQQVVDQIISVLRVAAPLVVYFLLIFGVTLAVTHRCGFGYGLCATQSFTAASNNFELAIAVAVATYGAGSHQALAATVGPLIEVPVLLGLVYAVKWWARRRGWKE